MMNFRNKNKKGSVLIFVVMVLFFVTVMGLAVAQIIFIEQRLGADYSSSQGAYYASLSGLEINLLDKDAQLQGMLSNKANYFSKITKLGLDYLLTYRGMSNLVQRQNEILFINNNNNNNNTRISVGTIHSLAIRSDGKLFAWGSNTFGKLGLGDTVPYEVPEKVGDDTWKMVAAGEHHSLAIRSDGKLFAWGLNSSGQLGLGNSLARYSPEKVGDDTWKMVVAGNYHSLAIRSDGKLFAWGINTYGQLGLGAGDTTTRYSPIQVGTSSWKEVVAGSEHSLAISSDGKLFAWGRNTYGQLGLGAGDTTTRYSPEQVGTSNWIIISSGKEGLHSLAIRSDGKLFAWGLNTDGQLGLGAGDTTTRYSPEQVGSENWSFVAAGMSHSIGILDDDTFWVWGFQDDGLGNGGGSLQSDIPVNINLI